MGEEGGGLPSCGQVVTRKFGGHPITPQSINEGDSPARNFWRQTRLAAGEPVLKKASPAFRFVICTALILINF